MDDFAAYSDVLPFKCLLFYNVQLVLWHVVLLLSMLTLTCIISLMICVFFVIYFFNQSINHCIDFFIANLMKMLLVGFCFLVRPKLKQIIRGSMSRGQETEQIQNTSKFVISVALHSFITGVIGATSHKAQVHAPLSTKTQVVLHLQNHLTSLIIL